ncbi:hypothetical protein Q1695_005167 [Nippostrongylus brasiliensis]|nr:hypothetical protein Q1695_005167 [Nippostrongylus brasiliensis]
MIAAPDVAKDLECFRIWVRTRLESHGSTGFSKEFVEAIAINTNSRRIFAEEVDQCIERSMTRIEGLEQERCDILALDSELGRRGVSYRRRPSS